MKRKGLNHRKLHLFLVGLILAGFVVFSFGNIIIEMTGEPVRDVGEVDDIPVKTSSCISSTEICDLIDNDCDGVIDENNVCDAIRNDDFVGDGKPPMPILLVGNAKIPIATKNQLPESEGYIVEMEDLPVIKYKKQQEEMGVLAKISAANYRSLISEKQVNTLNQIKNIAKKVEIGHLYRDTFNGFVVRDISEAEAKRIESLPEIKKVYPNYKVHTMLMDSVPLINADDVWNLQAS